MSLQSYFLRIHILVVWNIMFQGIFNFYGLSVSGKKCNLTTEERTCGFDYCFDSKSGSKQIIEIKSPNFPSNYSNNLRCVWTLKASFGARIKIKFHSFTLERSGKACMDDFMLIEDLIVGDRYCGTNPPGKGEYLSLAPQIVIRFITGPSFSFKGFKMEASIINVGNWKILKSPGIITTPKFPNPYPNNAYAIWTLQAPKRLNVALVCNGTFQLQKEFNCEQDALYVSDEPRMTKATGYCTKIPKLITSARNKLYLIFHSNAHTNAPGFHCFYDFNKAIAPYQWQRMPTCGCAQSWNEIDKKIVGGEPAGNEFLPWMVAITVGGSLICGGSLIAPHVIVTASHCFHGEPPSAVKVVIRNYNPWNVRNNRYITVRRLFVHPYFNIHRGFDYDIAVLIIDPPSDITTDQCICLPPAIDLLNSGEYARVYGWGKTGPIPRPVELQKLDITILELNACGRSWGWEGVSSRMICATSAGGKNACQGDSGGPLIKLVNNILRIIGTVSFGDPTCYDARSPTIYGRVSKYLNWIMRTSNMRCVPPP